MIHHISREADFLSRSQPTVLAWSVLLHFRARYLCNEMDIHNPGTASRMVCLTSESAGAGRPSLNVIRD
jgi:hypothetical protein